MISYLVKAKQLVLLSVFIFFISCNESEEFSDLKVTDSAFNDISGDGDVVSVNIECSTSWEVNSNSQWCKPDKTSGSGNALLTLSVDANLQQSVRTATVTITSGSVTKTVLLSQLASDGSEYHYKLPVIFHVLYNDAGDSKQFVNKGRLAEILEKVNQYYQDKVNSVDMNLEFILAETDPKGNILEEPGVERIKFDGTYPIDEDEFMSNNRGAYKYLLWDPNEYVNVMVYNFASDGGSTVTLGISHFPYTTALHFLSGTETVSNSYLTLDNLKYAYCVSINSLFIYVQNTAGRYYSTDVTATLAHELGHYLGLFHVFTADADGCEDTDYCDDTPSYNRKDYEAWMDKEQAQQQGNTMANLTKRTNCNGFSFVARNIMDYYFCYSDQFTADQRARVRHVLNYSPLVPGAKMTDPETRTVSDGLIDLPIRVIK